MQQGFSVRETRSSRHDGESPGFNLIELLVVIAIIAILAALLLPVLVDGHTERHKWVVGDTRRPPEPGGVSGIVPAVPPNDFDWLKEHTSELK